MLTKEHLDKLKAPFDDSVIGVKVQSFSKNRDRAMLVLYLQHTDVMNRLEQVDPAWRAHVVGVEHVKDVVYVRMSLNLLGSNRENVGEGDDYKSAYSDALKRCAMLFGVGRYLYDQEHVWVPYNEQHDKYKIWAIEEYTKSLRKKPDTAQVSLKTKGEAKIENQTPLSSASPSVSHKVVKDKSSLMAEIGSLMKAHPKVLTGAKIKSQVAALFGPKATSDTLTAEQLEHLTEVLSHLVPKGPLDFNLTPQ